MTAAPATLPPTAFSLDDLSRLVAQARTTEESQLTKLMEAQFGRVRDQIDAIDVRLKEGLSKFDKILDDHENRLRQQHDMDSKQAGDINTLHVNYAKLEGDLKAMEARLEGQIAAIQTTLHTRQVSELGFWQKVALESVKFAVFGGSMGGVIVAGMKAAGIL